MWETFDWFDKNQLAGQDEFQAKQAELEGVVSPTMTNLYPAAGGATCLEACPVVVSMMLLVPVGNVHEVVVVSASRTGERSSQVHGSSLLDVFCCPRS